MDTKTTLPISVARNRIFDIAKNIQKPGLIYTLTDKGRPKAVVMSAEEYESLRETLEVLKGFPDLEKDIAGLHTDIKTGAYKKYTTLASYLSKALKRPGKFKKANAVYSKAKTQSRKALEKHS